MISQWPPDLADFVANELAEGHYSSEAQLICEAVRLLRTRQPFDLRAELECGAADEHLDIVLEDDAALAAFFDEIDAEVDRELRSIQS